MRGSFGARLQKGIAEADDAAQFILDDEERCPFLNRTGLCDMITALGEDALCQICRDHPRFRNFYADRTEIGLGLCCEAAGELILSQQEKLTLITLEDDGAADLPDIADESLLAWREELFALAQDRSKPIELRAAEILQTAGADAFPSFVGRMGGDLSGVGAFGAKLDRPPSGAEGNRFDGDFPAGCDGVGACVGAASGVFSLSADAPCAG